MKKYLVSFAILAMCMAVITSCSKDEDETPVIELGAAADNLTIAEGETLTLTPGYIYVDENTTYKWFVNGQLISSTPTLQWTAPAAGQYEIVIEVANGDIAVQKSFVVTVVENTATLTFEGASWNALIDSPQNNGTLLYGDNAYNYGWVDQTTALASVLTKAWGGSFGFAEGGVAISNYIDANITEHANPDYQLAVPESNGSQNFAVVYCDASIYFPEGASRVIKSMDISPTTYELGVVLNGNEYASSLAESGNLTITITADNGQSLDVDLARDGNILRTWKTIDLTSLGAVNTLTFTMDGSDRSEYGTKHPKYFAFDNVVVKL